MSVRQSIGAQHQTLVCQYVAAYAHAFSEQVQSSFLNENDDWTGDAVRLYLPHMTATATGTSNEVTGVRTELVSILTSLVNVDAELTLMFADEKQRFETTVRRVLTGVSEGQGDNGPSNTNSGSGGSAASGGLGTLSIQKDMERMFSSRRRSSADVFVDLSLTRESILTGIAVKLLYCICECVRMRCMNGLWYEQVQVDVFFVRSALRHFVPEGSFSAVDSVANDILTSAAGRCITQPVPVVDNMRLSSICNASLSNVASLLNHN